VIPIVNNQTEPVWVGDQYQTLAGGNFYWVAQGDSTKGHNVYGIAGADTNLSFAPGQPAGTCGVPNACHVTLAAPPTPGAGGNFDRGGCQGCHVYQAHHDNGRPWYRFLKGHSANFAMAGSIDAGDYVVGVEDDDWEKPGGSPAHNYYSGTDVEYTPGFNPGYGLTEVKTLTGFCQGCHGQFHGPQRFVGKKVGMGSSSPWIRHPTDILLPEAGEFDEYNPVTNYSQEAPVAWKNPASPTRSEAVVMCLSCHRPHGSPYPDMLRWNYIDWMKTGGLAPPGKDDTGCFTCHRWKDNAGAP